ncbi:MAG: nucleotidyltransferase family protein [Paludibacteraceae bacterium]
MKEAIILAGGFGTRLKHIVSDVPKPMAPINGEPFLSVLLERLQSAGVERVILSTGYMHDKIEEFYGNMFKKLSLVYSQENIPLGTGGAILEGLKKAQAENVLVLNGDTLFDIDFSILQAFHSEKKTVISVALREIEDVSRYGAVNIDDENRIREFSEKNQLQGKGFINGGIYLINKLWFTGLDLPKQFSFEKEVLEKQYTTNQFYGLGFNAYFIDIGVPEDYFRAQKEIVLFRK